MIVCVCKNINETDLKQLLKENTIEHLMNTVGICRQCGTCRETVNRLLLENAVESCDMRV